MVSGKRVGDVKRQEKREEFDARKWGCVAIEVGV